MDRAAGRRRTMMIMAILSSCSIASLMKEDNYNKGCQSHSFCHGDLERERERERELPH
jgi:hypothetical protein